MNQDYWQKMKNKQNNFKLRPEVDDNNTVWYLWELVHGGERNLAGKHWTRTAKYKDLQEAIKHNPNADVTMEFSERGSFNGLFKV